MLYGSETCPVKEGVSRLERNNTRTVRWMCNIWPEEIISAEEHRVGLKLKRIRECLLVYRNSLVI